MMLGENAKVDAFQTFKQLNLILATVIQMSNTFDSKQLPYMGSIE